MQNIRNFSIIAHVDHGKSTISDQFIQICGSLTEREMSSQVLDSMDLEKERGITIKARNVTMNYHSKDLNKTLYQLNLIDTPGHVNFSYEVSRSLSACEGAILIVDASQGVEAQTLANCKLAMAMNLKIIPVLNKIDLITADIQKISEQINNLMGFPTHQIMKCSAKTGTGMIKLINKIITDIPSPKGNQLNPLQALIIDSWFDNYLGVISLICIKNGHLSRGQKIQIMSNKKVYKVESLGIFSPKKIQCNFLNCGQIGWIHCNIKNLTDILVGDTITLLKKPALNILPGFKKIKPQIYSGLFTTTSDQYETFKTGLKRLSLNDASLFFEPEHSLSLGFGFRCGFLGLLHMEIIKERLEREYQLFLILTAPTVIYEIKLTNTNIIYLDNPSKFPSFNTIQELREPIAKCTILSPLKFLGNIIKLCSKKRGIQVDIQYHNNDILIIYEIPMAEVILNFFDELKSVTKGYASLEYTFIKFKKSEIIRLDILINSNKIDALSSIIYKKNSHIIARNIIEKIKLTLPRHQFEIKVQAAIGNNIIASTIIKQLRKNVLSKCYGGDISRKKKLLKKQKDGKKKLKKIGKINIPQETFFTILNKHNKF